MDVWQSGIAIGMRETDVWKCTGRGFENYLFCDVYSTVKLILFDPVCF